MVKMCPMYWKWGSFLVRSKKLPKFRDFHSQILLNDFDFWQFSRDPRYVRVSGKFPNLNIFAPFGLWKSWTKKVPCPVHKNQKQCVLVFGCFVVVFVVVFVFFCMIWSNIIIFSPPEHRKHHLNLKWGDLIFWFRPISCTHFATPQPICSDIYVFYVFFFIFWCLLPGLSVTHDWVARSKNLRISFQTSPV